METICIIQARMRSSRLPGKVLLDVAGEPLLARIEERVRRIRGLSRLVIGTSDVDADDPIEELCAQRGWVCFRGSEDDVLDRYYQAAKHYQADHVVRVTADSPLICVEETERLIAFHLECKADYTHNLTVWGSGIPWGTSSEVFTFETLERSWREGLESHHREHVNEYVYEQSGRFRFKKVCAPPELRRPDLRLTIDAPEDLEMIRRIFGKLYRPGEIISLRQVIELLDKEPSWVEINKHVVQRSGSS
jgi:spore coat polysaccharide biosynthesis protein SpsF